MRRRPPTERVRNSAVRLWGRHAVYAALDNPLRTVRHLWGTREAIGEIVVPTGLAFTFAGVQDLAKMVAPGAPHQGLVIEVDPLPERYLDEFLGESDGGVADHRPLLILDQVTDPQNVGAILRSAAAFDAAAIITQDRHSPPESGVVARAAAGALEIVPWVRVVNLARALDEIAEGGFWRIGLSGKATDSVSSVLKGVRPALVLGAEGDGMRANTEAHCDQLARLPIAPQMESLNVSNAAAIALYAAMEARGS